MTLTVGEPLGDVSGSANHDFRTSVTVISGEIDASYISFYAKLRNAVLLIWYNFMEKSLNMIQLKV